MKAVLHDVWHDLVRKRLLPVAAALLVAVVALPMVLLRGGGDAAPGEPAASAPAAGVPGGSTGVRLASGVDPSDLQAFDPRDPFEPGAGAPRTGAESPPAADGSGTATVVPVAPAPAASSANAGQPSAAAPASSAPSPGRAPSRARTETRDDRRSGERPDGPAEEPSALTYTVDVKVGRPGSEATRTKVPTLSLLPSEADPRFVFLGTTLSGRTAIFLVDAAMQGTHEGDGACRPSPSECAFLYLRPEEGRNRAVFTLPSDNDYFAETRRIALELVRINREPVRRVQQREDTRRRRARASRRRARPAYRPFVAPLFR